DSACVPPCTGEVTTLPRLQVQPVRPLSNPGLVTRLVAAPADDGRSRTAATTAPASPAARRRGVRSSMGPPLGLTHEGLRINIKETFLNVVLRNLAPLIELCQ